MPINVPPIQNPIASQGGTLTQVWVRFFSDLYNLLSNTQPQQVPAYTVLTVPDATLFTGYIIYVSNESGGAVIAFSDGIAWRRCTDRAIIS